MKRQGMTATINNTN